LISFCFRPELKEAGGRGQPRTRPEITLLIYTLSRETNVLAYLEPMNLVSVFHQIYLKESVSEM